MEAGLASSLWKCRSGAIEQQPLILVEFSLLSEVFPEAGCEQDERGAKTCILFGFGYFCLIILRE